MSVAKTYSTRILLRHVAPGEVAVRMSMSSKPPQPGERTGYARRLDALELIPRLREKLQEIVDEFNDVGHDVLRRNDDVFLWPERSEPVSIDVDALFSAVIDAIVVNLYEASPETMEIVRRLIDEGYR